MVHSHRSRLALAPVATSIWPSLRVLVEYLLDIADIARRDGPVLDVLILTLVVEANVAAVNQDPVLQRRYSAIDAPPPDELRRPVSISSVAASLRLPYETVRRHLLRLAELGACELGPKGVLVPTARLASPEYAAIAAARYERTRRLYFDLRAIEGLPPIAAPRRAPPDLSSAEPPVRLCARLLSEFYLRVMELLGRRVGDPVSSLLVLGLARANMAGLSEEARAAPVLLPEDARTPVRRSMLATQMGLPAETVRRRLIDLEERGYCRTTRGGVMIARGALQRPEALRLLQENHANLVRFMSRLQRYGIIDLWEAERG